MVSLNGKQGLIRINPHGTENSLVTQTVRISNKTVVEELPTPKYAYLEIHCNGASPVIVQLDETETLIGRGAEARIQIQLPSVSRSHARLVYKNDEYIIEDLNSTNGTFVNGVRVKKCALRSSDQIQIGQVKVYFIEERVRGIR